MASVFTFDPNPMILVSPWPSPPRLGEVTAALTGGENLPIASLADCGVTKLRAEPQDGPTEYKLHLLLRPRRSFSALSTVRHVSGSHQSKSKPLQADVKADIKRSSPGTPPSSQSRQNRLQHLTTQLLWRLQQSSPYHSSSSSDLVIPILPQAHVKPPCPGPNKLLPGLGESQGALYEIGVSDDGVLVGLTEDELQESLTTLRAMASSLGCKVEVLRMVHVGSCQWAEGTQQVNGKAEEIRTENLWVAEALVTPSHDSHNHTINMESMDSTAATHSAVESIPSNTETEKLESHTEQLRVSLTGCTTSGKSSLLGTLSTSTLDNGRGKSRLSLLKHPHEIVSGISSSVTPELIGYHDTSLSCEGINSHTNVINYATGNISTWNDIHCASQPGRLVFFTDSAGHPRYRRTIVRGLVSWAPHWTLCCIAADGEDESSSKTGKTASSREILGPAGADIDLSVAHLLLCLKLNLPLVVVITKLDLASRRGLRQTLTKTLSILKSSARQPAVLPPDDLEPSLQALAKADEDAVLQTVTSVTKTEVGLLVPIVFTSAVTGKGISKLHALLRHLPVPRVGDNSLGFHSQSQMSRPTVLFHIDEVFSMGDSQLQFISAGCNGAQGVILSGHLRYGTLVDGDELLVGPFNSDAAAIDSERRGICRAHSFPGQLQGNLQNLPATHDEHRPASSEFSVAAHDVQTSSSRISGWHRLHIISIRNLRLPVRKLLAGQVGTVGITFGRLEAAADFPSTSTSRVRKGMVLINAADGFDDHLPALYRGFSAVIDERGAWPVVPGTLVIIYIASIRAAAKILAVQSHARMTSRNDVFPLDVEDDDSNDVENAKISLGREQEVTFQFEKSREWIELGTQVLIMPAGGLSIGQAGGADNVGVGLEGLVGWISQTIE